MNGKKAKRIRKKALHLLVEWLKLQLPEKEAEKLNISNIKNIKKLKNKKINDISMKDIDMLYNKEKFYG